MLRHVLPDARAFFAARKSDVRFPFDDGPRLWMRDAVKPAARLWIKYTDGADNSVRARSSRRPENFQGDSILLLGIFTLRHEFDTLPPSA